MSRTSPLTNIFDVDREASVVPISVNGLSLPSVKSAGILNDPEYPKVEGRGSYVELPDASSRYQYVKGSGNGESLRSAGDGDLRRFPQFGHVSSSKFCFGPQSAGDSTVMSPSRVRGALYLPYAVGEVINAAVFLEVMMRKEKIPTLSAAEAKGLTVPEGMIFSPGISSDICEGLARIEFERRRHTASGMVEHKYALAALRVPACARLRSRGDVASTKGDFWIRVLRSPEKMEMVGRVLKHQLECGFVSLSTHLQNVYDAPESLCPHADNSDLVAISEILARRKDAKIERKLLLEAVVIGQLEYLPFNLMRYASNPTLQNDAKGAIHTILSTVAPGEWSFQERESFATNFSEKPYTVLSSIANRLIDMRMVSTMPQVDWQKIRREHARFAYDVVGEHMVNVAFSKACALYARIAEAELNGGLTALY